MLSAVRFGVTILWDMTPCSLIDVCRNFGGAAASIFRIEECTD
jgi:hypothetical protein